jgi:hypothetical protein
LQDERANSNVSMRLTQLASRVDMIGRDVTTLLEDHMVREGLFSDNMDVDDEGRKSLPVEFPSSPGSVQEEQDVQIGRPIQRTAVVNTSRQQNSPAPAVSSLPPAQNESQSLPSDAPALGVLAAQPSLQPPGVTLQPPTPQTSQEASVAIHTLHPVQGASLQAETTCPRPRIVLNTVRGTPFPLTSFVPFRLFFTFRFILPLPNHVSASAASSNSFRHQLVFRVIQLSSGRSILTSATWSEALTCLPAGGTVFPFSYSIYSFVSYHFLFASMILYLYLIDYHFRL